MINNIINYIDEHFSFLIDELGFIKINEEYDDQYLEVIFQSQDIRIRIEKYRRDLYMYVAPILDPNNWANIFNIINYLNKNTNKKIESKYSYSEIKNLDKYHKMQVKWLSKVLKENYQLINIYCDKKHYRENSEQLREFMIEHYPNLFYRG